MENSTDKEFKRPRGRPFNKIDLVQDGQVAMTFDTVDELAEFVGKSRETIYKNICLGQPIQKATPLSPSVWYARWQKENKYTLPKTRKKRKAFKV